MTNGDFGVVFFHADGFSTACGHGTIALVTWAIDSGLIKSKSDVIEVTVDVPSGRYSQKPKCSTEKLKVFVFKMSPLL